MLPAARLGRATLLLVVLPACRTNSPAAPTLLAPWTCGQVVAHADGVPIYSNGPGLHSCVEGPDNRHRHADGYSYGRKWQCVEFVRRYYKDHFEHEMPSPWGNAADYFVESLPHGAHNPDRDLIQLRNGGPDRPRAGDLVVFRDAAGGYGHVAIALEVEEDRVVLAQQNLHPALDPVSLTHEGGHWTLGGGATGFLRIKTPGP